MNSALHCVCLEAHLTLSDPIVAKPYQMPPHPHTTRV